MNWRKRIAMEDQDKYKTNKYKWASDYAFMRRNMHDLLPPGKEKILAKVAKNNIEEHFLSGFECALEKIYSYAANSHDLEYLCDSFVGESRDDFAKRVYECTYDEFVREL